MKLQKLAVWIDKILMSRLFIPKTFTDELECNTKLNAIRLEASCHLAAGRLDAAIDLWRQVIDKSPEHVDSLFDIGIQEINRGNIEIGRAYSERAIAAQNSRARRHLLGRLGVRFLSNRWANPWAIGHLSTEVEMFLKAGKIWWKQPYIGVLTAQSSIANECLWRYWEKKLIVVSHQFWVSAFKRVSKILEIDSFHLRTPDGHFGHLDQVGAKLNDQWNVEKRVPLLKVSKKHRRNSYDVLQQAGFSLKKPFVCLHMRGSGFHAENCDSLHAVRSVCASTYQLAIKACLARGYHVVRIGDATMERLGNLPGVFDYAHSPLKSASLDIFLAVQAKFFFGNSSGMSVVRSPFGRSVALTNWIPLHAPPIMHESISIPKLLRLKKTGEMLSLTQALTYRIGTDYGFQKMMADNIEIVPNSSEELAEFFEEVLDGEQPSRQDEILRKRYADIIAAHDYRGPIKIGLRFLRRYEHLI